MNCKINTIIMIESYIAYVYRPTGVVSYNILANVHFTIQSRLLISRYVVLVMRNSITNADMAVLK